MAHQPREKEKPTAGQMRYIAIMSYKLGIPEPYIATYGEAGHMITEMKKELEYRRLECRKQQKHIKKEENK